MRKSESRRRFILGAASTAAVLHAPRIVKAATATSSHGKSWPDGRGRLRIGLLWSLTGNLSVIEKPSKDVVMYWAEEVNRDGGVAGMQVEPVVVDAKSDIKAYREGVRHLIDNEAVLAVFGGYTSASRRAIMPLVEISRGLLFYPASYYGRECWQRIICTGPVPNQHSLNLVPYMCRQFGPRVYFVGSNNVGSRESNRNARKWLGGHGGEVAGEAYIPMGYGDFSGVLSTIKKVKPDWIFSTVIGKSDLSFRWEYAKAGFTPDKLPTASLTTSEIEVGEMGHEFGEGHIVSAPYFQSLVSETNHRFVDGFLSSPYGESGVTHFTMEETYLACQYFKKSVERLVTSGGVSAINPQAVRDECGGLSLSANESPEGPVKIDPGNFNSWLTPKVGRFNASGQVEILSQSAEPVPPLPYKLYPERGKCNVDGLHLPTGQIVESAS